MTTDARTPEEVAALEAEEQAKRREELARMPLDKLLRQVTDAELHAEGRRVGQEATRPKREWRIGEAEAHERLERVMSQLPAFRDAAVEKVRSQVERNTLDPSTLAQALLACDAVARPDAHVKRLRDACSAGNGQIVTGDPKGDAAKRRRSLDARRVAISEELRARDLARRNVNIPKPKGRI